MTWLSAISDDVRYDLVDELNAMYGRSRVRVADHRGLTKVYVRGSAAALLDVVQRFVAASEPGQFRPLGAVRRQPDVVGLDIVRSYRYWRTRVCGLPCGPDGHRRVAWLARALAPPATFSVSRDRPLDVVAGAAFRVVVARTASDPNAATFMPTSASDWQRMWTKERRRIGNRWWRARQCGWAPPDALSFLRALPDGILWAPVDELERAAPRAHEAAWTPL